MSNCLNNRCQIVSIGIVVSLITARVTNADCPGRVTLVGVNATARARIVDQTGQTCGSTGACTDEKVLNAPGSITAQMNNVAGSNSATANVTISVISSGGGVERIDITGAATAQPFPLAQGEVISAGAEFQVVDGPVIVTVTENTRTVLNGVVTSEVILTQSFNVFPPASSIHIVTNWGAFATSTPSTSSNNSFALEFAPLTAQASGAFVWANASGGSYTVGSNWNPACIPVHNGVRSDTVIFDLDTGSPIPINAAAATAGRWSVQGGVFNVSGPAEVFDTNGVSLEIADGAQLNLTGSTLTSVSTAVGGFGPTAFLNVVNPGTALHAGGMGIGNGFLDVTLGGQVVSQDLTLGLVPGDVARVKSSGVSNGTPSGVRATGTLSIGDTGTGTLTIFDGGFARGGVVSIGDNGTGTVQVKGSANPNDPFDLPPFAALFSDTLLSIGGSGQGLLTIENGGAAQASLITVDAAGTAGTGRVIIDGQGSLAVLTALVSMGVAATELVEVEAKDGGAIQAQSLSLGSAAVRPGAADLTVRGSFTQQDATKQSKLRVRDMPGDPLPAGLTSVGALAEGQLNILDGAQATLEGGLVVGESARGVMVVSLPFNQNFFTTSTLTVTGETRIGDGAPGFLTVSNAIMRSLGDVRLGLFAGQTISSFSVEASELNVQGTLAVGVTGQGEMTIKNSSPSLNVPVTECQTLTVGGSQPQGGGTLVLINSNVLVLSNAQVGVDGPGTITIDDNSTLTMNGTITIGGPAFGGVVVNGLMIGAGTVVVVPNGHLAGSGTVTIPKVKAGGEIAPGLSPGTLTINGDLELLPTGILTMEIASLEPGQFDVLKVNGNTTLGGTLLVKFIDGFVPSAGDSLKMLEIGGTVTGQFAEVRVEGLPEGQALNVDPISGQISVGATAAATVPPNVCGAGACGAGIAPLWMTVCAIWVLRPVVRRRGAR